MTNHRPTSAPGRRIVPWLIACLLAGSVLIYFFQPSPTHLEIDLFIPVEHLHIKEGLTATSPLGASVEIRASGPEASLEALKKEKLTYKLDLVDAGVGVASFPVDPTFIQLPKGVSIVKIRPAFLTVRIEPEIRKVAPVEASLSGKPAPGFYIDDTVETPGSITLRGAKSLVAPIERVATKPLDIDGLAESIKKEVVLDLPEGVTVMAPSELILVELSVKEKITTRVFENIPVPGKDASSEYTITPPVIRVEIKGPVNTLDSLRSRDALKVHVDLKGLHPGVYARRAVIQLPVGVSLMAASPEIFTVRIKKE